MNKTLCKQFFTLILFFPSIGFAFPQSTVLGTKSWQTVLSGNVLSKIEPSSYGFVVITEGRLLNAFSENGQILWQRNLGQKGSGFCVSMNGDFVYTAIDKKLSLFNTSGIALWTIETKTPIVEKPLPGWDGRLFVREKNAISSYTINGLLRFRLEVSDGLDFPLLTLNDGSLLYMQKKNLSGKSTALRISPFGAILEEIIFVDTITSLTESKKGLILGLENGNLAVCHVVDNLFDTKWSIKIENKNILDVFFWEDSILVQFTDGSFALFDEESKEEIWQTGSITKEKIEDAIFDMEKGIFRSFSRIFVINKDGSVEKNIQVQNNSRFSGLTESGFFVEVKDDWSISAYRIALVENRLHKQSQIKTYPLPPVKASSAELYKNAPALLQSINLFETEAELISRLRLDIKTVQNSYLFMEKPSQSFEMLALKIKTIQNAAYLGTGEPMSFFESILDRESDESILFQCLRAIQKNAYDYDMRLLLAIEKRLVHTNQISDALLEEYCYTITEICRFMGRKTFMRKGKDLLFSFLDAKYKMAVQETARECLEKIIAFEK